MGNSVSRVVGCFLEPVAHDREVFFSDPLDEGLGHSFCYVRPPLDSPDSPSHSDSFLQNSHLPISSNHVDHVDLASTAPKILPHDVSSDKKSLLKAETTFKSISGASVSANTSTPRTIVCHEQFHSFTNVPDDRAAAFESTSSFSSLPLQPIPRGVTFSGPISGAFSGPISERGFMSGPIERGLLSGPLERGFLSGPLERGCMSGPIEFSSDRNHFSAPLAGNYSLYMRRKRTTMARLINTVGKPVKRALRRTLSKTSSTVARTQRSLVAPIKQFVWGHLKHAGKDTIIVDDSQLDLGYTSSDIDSKESHNLQWAQGKAGEDRVHVVLSDRHGWLFVGIYDGFNGPDAPDFLMRNLYTEISRKLQGLLWDRKEDSGVLKKSEADGQNDCHVTHTRLETDRTTLSSLLKNDERESQAHTSSFTENVQNIVCGFDGSPNGEEGKHDWKGVVVMDPSANEQNSGRPQRLIDEDQLKHSDACPSKEIAENFEQETLLVDQNTCVRCSNSDADALCDIAPDKTSPHAEGKIPALGTDQLMQTSSPDINVNKSRPQVNRRSWKRRFFVRPKFWHRHSRNKESHRKSAPWRYDWEHDGEESDKSQVEASKHSEFKQSISGAVDHSAVLKALARALELTEKAYLEMADQALEENPELALMGSCILVMLMKGEDVYVMNVGDSRAIVAQQRVYDHHQPSSTEDSQSYSNDANSAEKIGARDSLLRLDLERIIEETPTELEALEAPYSTSNMGLPISSLSLNAKQLSTDHSTSIEGEINRIKSEHPDDNASILNDRVKGRLKVTRAFGAGFLKKPRWNNAILEMFRIDYVGSAPYISCTPALCHHRLGPNDHFLILSSDGLYQYLSNQEVISHVQWFLEKFPEGDPAQHLIEELLFRAAKKAGMDFHELLDIPQGERRKYHDDVSVMVISLEGRIWRSSG